VDPLNGMRAIAGRVPPVAAVVFAVALLNGLAWSLLTPAFQVPDETSHFAYAQYVAETGHRAGTAARPEFSSEQAAVMGAINTFGIIGRPLVRTVATRSGGAQIDRQIEEARDHAARDNGGGPSTASSQPPLFYAIEAVPYRLFAWASLPVRLHAMRALAAVMFALSAALCALFVAELLPSRPWAPLAGGLALALSPYSAFIATGVTPDALLLLVSTAVLYLVVRAFRHGLTRRGAAALGFCVGAGVVTKLTFIGFVPVALLALAVLLWRDWRRGGGAIGVAAVAIGAGLVLPLLVLAWAVITGGALRPPGTGTPPLPPDQIKPFNAREFLSYTWQVYLPRPGFLVDQFHFSAPYETWIKGFAGRFGWLDYQVPDWVAHLARQIVVVGIALIVLALVRLRAAVRRHWLELVVLLAFAAVIAIEIAKKGYDYHRQTGLIFEQPRYLFPLAGLYAGAVAVALAGLGRRVARALAVVAIGLFAVHDLTGLMTTLARYYG
jgi:4-amino-4-deoxy-L-arabinose transferase-like glycosyltransferase